MEIELIDIGRAIQERLREINMTQLEFAKKLGITQPSANVLLKKQNIDTEKLRLISVILDFNFFELYCTDKRRTNTEPVNITQTSSGSFETYLINKNEELTKEIKKLNDKILVLVRENAKLSYQNNNISLEKEGQVV